MQAATTLTTVTSRETAASGRRRPWDTPNLPSCRIPPIRPDPRGVSPRAEDAREPSMVPAAARATATGVEPRVLGTGPTGR
ncbi:hypothetical protein GCM10023108_10540 [Saccharopolyspora hordei]